jgi:hypothetical protein
MSRTWENAFDRIHQRHAGACRTAFRGVPGRCAKILLVGEDNPLSTAPEHALFCAPRGCAGQRLQELIFGLPRVQYLALWRTNLCVGTWSFTASVERANLLMHGETPWNIIVGLGTKVADAFQRADKRMFPAKRFEHESYLQRIVETPGQFTAYHGALILLPHPSGRNACQWPKHRIFQARALVAELAPELAWGTVA